MKHSTTGDPGQSPKVEKNIFANKLEGYTVIARLDISKLKLHLPVLSLTSVKALKVSISYYSGAEKTSFMDTLLKNIPLALLTAALERWKNSQHTAQWHRRDKIYAEKLLSMDFCSVDDPYTHDLHSQIKQNNQFAGWGLARFQWDMEVLTGAVVRITGAVVLVVTLFTLRVPQSAGALTVLNSPLSIVVIIAIMLAVTLTAPVFTNKGNAYWAKNSDSAKMGNRVFSFYGFMAYDQSRALDIRMFRQDILSRHGMEKDKSFSPDSEFAGYARGPMGSYQALSAAISNAFTGIVYVYVCLKAWGGAFGIGAVTQYVGAITQLSSGVSELVSTLGYMHVNATFLRTAFEFLDIPNDMYQGSLTVEKRSDRQYYIEFRNVSFRYPGTETRALRNVSLKFNVGERLAVVERNGSGKTTFIKLLCRLYDPTEGEILLNGIDIRKYDYLEYMSIFSVVFQDFKLLSFGLGQNVAAREVYDRKQAIDCLEAAGFGDRLRDLPQGIDTNLYKDFDEKGVEISGGEAQKIALARALYKAAPFVILDEPTAALDPIAEHDIYTRFNSFVGNRTAIYISHRLSSCRFCDDIAVFDGGHIVQQGNHEQLVEDGEELYYQLWNAQAQYYQREEQTA